tara:strand:- start:6768 stop:7961 length:1194 start_codon:yes stop_codon:yes gene_type:complete
MQQAKHIATALLSRTLLSIVILILLATATLGLGVSPAKVSVNYDPGPKDIQFTLHNTIDRPLAISVGFRGVFQDNIIAPNSIIFPEGKTTKPLPITINLPENLAPGIYSTEVILQEEYSVGEQDLAVGARASVIGEILVKVPAPGKHINVGWSYSEKKDKVRMVFPVKNIGTDPIDTIQASIRIEKASLLPISISTDSISLDTRNEGKLIALWEPNLPPGIYPSTATIDYDEHSTILEKNIQIGSPIIEISKIIPEPYQMGEIAVFQVYLNNEWNSEVTNTKLRARIYDDQNTLATYETETIALPPNTETPLKIFWDTATAQPGSYNMDLSLFYHSSEKQATYNFILRENGIVMTTPTGAVTADTLLSEQALITTAIILVLLIIGWLVYFRKKIIGR